MSELDTATAEWRDKRLDRIEALLDSMAAKVDRNSDIFAEDAKRNADLIAENRKSIAELKESTVILEAKLDQAMKWMPLKSGLWTVGIILSAIVGIAALPEAAEIIMRLFGDEG